MFSTSYRTLRSFVYIILFILPFLSIQSNLKPVYATPLPADSFDFFVNIPDGGTRAPWYTAYNARNPYLTQIRPCYNKALSQIQHAGEDWFRPAGTSIHAVANGRVIYARNANYPGAVIIIEHNLPEGWTTPWGNRTIYSMYGHLSTTGLIAEFTDVTKGQRIGSVLDQGSNSHTHFEMRRYGDMSGILVCPSSGASSWSGPGYTNTDINPETFGYIDPSAWVDSHRALQTSTACRAPSLQSPSAGQVLTDRRVTFSWQSPGCGQGYTLRVKDVSSMDSGGTAIYDEGVGETSRTVDIPEQWIGRTLYWGVKAANASNASWAVQSFRIENPTSAGTSSCTPNADQIALYEHANFLGRCSLLGPKDYHDPGQMGLDNDSASSVKVGANVRVILFEHAEFAGRSETFTGDDASLVGNSIGNDSASSARVERRTTNDVCRGPDLNGPADHAVLQDPSVTFSWNPPSSCSFSGYTFRIKDSPNMELGGTILIDEGQGGTSVTQNIPAAWQYRDLYWGVRTSNPLSPNWSVRHFRIEPPRETDPQSISTGQTIDAQIDPADEDDTFSFDGSAGQLVTIVMERSDSSNLDSFLELHGPAGLITINDDGAGNRNSRIVATLPQNGSYRILAHSYNHSSSGAYRITLNISTAQSDGDDGRWLSYGQSLQGTINPSSDRDTYYVNAVAGRTITLRMRKVTTALDSFLELYGPDGSKITENDDSGGDSNAWIVTDLNTAGTYRIVARSYNGSSVGGYSISIDALSGNNLAQGQIAYVSSIENDSASYAPSHATDGDSTTRWSSAFQDYQWIYVDLGQERSINQIVLRWERAFADQYGLYAWNSAQSQWNELYSTNTGDGDIDTISFTPVTTRYVMLYARHRYAYYGWEQYGFSLWEFEVYNTLTALVPTVPPDSTDKASETLQPLVPLPPNPTGKDLTSLSAGSAQENMPSRSSSTEQIHVVPGEIYGPPMTNLQLSAHHILANRDQLILTAIDACDTDEQGQGIMAYRWKSNIDGLLGNQAVVTLNANVLSPGQHMISLEVQDNEGNWSTPVSEILEVVNRSCVYVPLINR